jgi:hypothetical protein
MPVEPWMGDIAQDSGIMVLSEPVSLKKTDRTTVFDATFKNRFHNRCSMRYEM